MLEGNTVSNQEPDQGEIRYTEEHEWVRAGVGGTRDSVRVGITSYAQEQLGDVVFVDLPQTGQSLAVGEVFGEVESTKSVSELFMPLAGEIVAVNDTVSESPELLNSDPYGDGWLIEIAMESDQAFADLLTDQAYQDLITD